MNMSDDDHRNNRTEQNQANGHDESSEGETESDETDATLRAQQGCDSHK